jgi:hypothetical protein
MIYRVIIRNVITHRRSGRERRNLGSMDGRASERPCNLDSGDPCRNDGAWKERDGKGFRRSGRERRNLGSMDGLATRHPCNLDSGGPCRNDGLI